MNISEPFIRRPVATTLIAVGIGLFGILAFKLLPVAPLPEVEFPTISVSARLAGAEPETVAALVATPLERQFGQISGVTQMTSVSSLGATNIILQFDLNRNIDGAARDVQAAINAAKANLPSSLEGNPTYRKVNPADAPILILSLTSDSASPGQLYDAASTVLQQKLLQIPGVGTVTVGGSSLPAVRIELNPNRLSHYGISLEQVRTVIANSNVNTPKGSIAFGADQYLITANDMLYNAWDYEPLIVQTNGNSVVRITDLGYVQEGIENVQNFGLSNGQPAVLLIVYKQPGSNVIEAVDNVKEVLPFLEASISPAIKLGILMDRTTTIRAALLEVEITLIIAILLVVGVTFVFFRSWRATLIPAIVVPLSLLGTFSVMYFLGFSLNNLSLMALTISTGFVVDDAIVVVENTMRHLEKGKKPFEAALTGAKEVGFTVFSISVSLVAVFIPLLLMGGLVGRLFREFSVSLSVAIAMSMFISLTVTPMLCRIALKHQPVPQGEVSSRDYPDSIFHRFYAKTLGWVIHRPGLMGLLVLVIMALNAFMYVAIPKGFFPQEDTGRLIGIVKASQSISYQAMQEKFQMINQQVMKNPNVEGVGGFIGGASAINNGFLFVMLKPINQRRATADDVMAQLRHDLADIPGVELYLQSAQDISVGGRLSAAQYQYTLTADTQETLEQWVPKIVDTMRNISGLQDVNTDQQNNSLRVNVNVNRDTASRLGVSFDSIDQALYDAFGQRLVSTIYKSANQYHVVMELAPEYWASPDALHGIYVPTTASDKSNLIPLSAMASFDISSASLSVNHQGVFPAVTVSFNLRPNFSIGTATQQINDALAELKLPTSISGGFAGTAQVFQQSSASEPLLIAAALLAVYLVLGMLYENLIHPLTILSTLPSAGIGALIALWITGTQLSIIALVGIILLIGIVKKNAIMMIDFALTEARLYKLSSEQAITRACMIRFRPIMMTTCAAILGALPLVLSSGYGSEFRWPLGISIIGGLLFSQALTLYTTPVIYLWLDRLSIRLEKRRVEI